MDQVDDVAFRLDEVEGGEGGAEVGVDGDDEVEFHQHGEQGGQEDAECGVDVGEAEDSDGEGGGFAEEGGYGGGVGCYCGLDVVGHLVALEDAVEGAAECVDTDGEGVDVVHSEMIRCHAREDEAAEDEW